MRINGGCSLVVAGILISLDLLRQGGRGEQKWRLWEHREQEKRTGNKRERIREKEREGVRVARPRATLTVPDLNMQHQIKHPLMRPWVAVSGYGMQLVHMQACGHTHTKSLPAILSCKVLAIVI